MFLNFLVRRHCSICHKLDRSSIVENNTGIGEFTNNDLSSEEPLCSCSETDSFYYKPTILLRVFQTITLVLLFVTTISILLVVRNTATFNAGVSTVVSGYVESQKGFDGSKSETIKQQFATQIIHAEHHTK